MVSNDILAFIVVVVLAVGFFMIVGFVYYLSISPALLYCDQLKSNMQAFANGHIAAPVSLLNSFTSHCARGN
jgi:uncharacterized membrane protein YfcA